MAFQLHLSLPETNLDNSPAFKKVCDQFVITRLLIGAHRFGAARIVISGDAALLEQAKFKLASDPRLADIDMIWGKASESDLPIVAGSADVVIGKTAWKLLAEATTPVHLPGAEHWTKNVSDGQTTKPLWPEFEWQKGRFAIPATSASNLRQAKQEIFLNITKDTSGPVSRYLNSKISIPLSKLLVETPFTPNQMTITNTVVGIVSALFFAVGTLPAIAIGGLIFQLSSALDRNDGELARSKFMESEKGAWIDTVGDNITYVTFMVCFVLGYARYCNVQSVAWAQIVLPLGIGLVAATAGLIGWMFWYVKKNDLGGTMTAISRQFESEIDGQKSNGLYRWLTKLRVMGERDQFSLAVMAFAVLPVLTGNDNWYHAMFFTTVLVVIAMNIYFISSTAKLRHARREVK